ncbi:MAG TPA: hypothetical protein VGZ47_00995 [Gemmataceae bacterium]|nr:hypothetical protein [Gemmataceae bacterium]
MKTSGELQRESVIRKVIYFGLIVLLFTIMSFSGSVVSALRGGVKSDWTISNQAERLQLSELSQGQADLAGSTVRLMSVGTRGFVVCGLWILTMESQKRHEWNRVEKLTISLTKLQPHFLTPWLYQSWNLSYNVSVESDRVRDKFFYIAKGINLLAEGERINRGHGVAPDGTKYEVGNPDMRFWVGFYYLNKFGVSDEAITLKSLLQMSSIKPSERTGFRPDGKIDAEKFKTFVKQHPQLCRRLRDHLRCNRPDDLVDFLEDNSKLPTRFEERDGKWERKRNYLEQFPVVPDAAVTVNRLSPFKDFDDYVDSNLIAWTWDRFAQEPLPPYIRGKPAFGAPPDYDKFRYRIPRQPVSIIFRQYPQRCQTAIAERLQKEGWFDDQGWVIDERRLTDRWFPEERLVAGADRVNSALEEWKRAYEMWKTHGEEHGLNLSPEKEYNLNQEAQVFRSKFGLEKGMPLRDEPTPDQLGPELWRGYDAHMQLIFWQQNLFLTNFNHFLFQSEAESDPRIAEVRKLLFQAEAERGSGNPEPAIRYYEQAFSRLTGDVAAGKRGLLEIYPNFRNDNHVQEDLYEKQITYLDLLYSQRGPMFRTAMTACGLFGCSQSFSPEAVLSACVYQYSARHRELPSPFQGPLDGLDSNGQQWVTEQESRMVRARLGLLNPGPAPMTAPAPKMPIGASPSSN